MIFRKKRKLYDLQIEKKKKGININSENDRLYTYFDNICAMHIEYIFIISIEISNATYINRNYIFVYIRIYICANDVFSLILLKSKRNPPYFPVSANILHSL